MNEGFAYFRWMASAHPGARGLFYRGIQEWEAIAVRDWWWCSGCYDWHWSPVERAR